MSKDTGSEKSSNGPQKKAEPLEFLRPKGPDDGGMYQKKEDRKKTEEAKSTRRD
ncbi:hypothetical protein [Rhodococcus koreensis]|uniref:hypothetical protein n=1 Tax=Rhodococcus koreensis TaxID=99653 RepID=UPI001982665D|nr:hypothetical protein [Rhodococcus koreensis]QSE87073.1 hypothetical protein JWS14_49235 [Rhodococcus koreensis]